MNILSIVSFSGVTRESIMWPEILGSRPRMTMERIGKKEKQETN